MLQRPEMEQLRQRVIASCHLGPMDAEETKGYIVHRLQTVGWRGDPSFSDDVFAAIHQYSGGIPRKVNILCDRLLLLGCLEQKRAFTGMEMGGVIDEMQQEFASANPQVTQEGGV